MKVTGNKNVKIAKKIFTILEEIAKHDGMKLKDLTNATGFPKSTVHRLLSSLVDIGYVYQEEKTGKYALGLRILLLAQSVFTRLKLREIAYPFLEALQTATNETANLVIMDQDEALYIEKVTSDAMLGVFSRIGKSAPLHATGVGKVLLAEMAWTEVMSILENKGLFKLTPNTITSLDVLMDELYNVRKKGYAIDDEECELGAFCIAAPIRDFTRKVNAAISISMPKNRLTEEKKNDYILQVKKYGDLISKKLGYQPGKLDQYL